MSFVIVVIRISIIFIRTFAGLVDSGNLVFETHGFGIAFPRAVLFTFILPVVGRFIILRCHLIRYSIIFVICSYSCSGES